MKHAFTALALAGTTLLGACATTHHTPEATAPSAPLVANTRVPAGLPPARAERAKTCMLIKRDRPSAVCDSFSPAQNAAMDEVIALYRATRGDGTLLTPQQKAFINSMAQRLGELEGRS